MNTLHQHPAPGSHHVGYCGDVFRMTLSACGHEGGKAWVRTHLGNAAIRRQEIIASVEKGIASTHREWRDLPMTEQEDGSFLFEYPLCEVGRFDAKCFLMDPKSGELYWPEGANVVVKVEPANTRKANMIYCAFVRQFGAHRRRAPNEQSEQEIEDLEAHGYAVLPPSGKFRDLVDALDVIMDEMGFRIIQLLPIHPTPTTYARMGRYGSPYASQDYEEIDPALAEFDRKSTPLEQFGELADAVHRRQGLLFLDIPINHTGWASRIQIHHPEWFVREHDRTFKSPGAWGVTWEDLSKLDYGRRDLWFYMADMFLYWCRQGVDGFRCDAGYKVPVPVWQYIIAKVRQQYPDTLFFLEGLGGPLQTVSALLDKANMDWAYSELFQEYTRESIEPYLTSSLERSRTRGVHIHFAETHDNLRLAATSTLYARMRCALSALCSHAGGYGITNGVEWFATERVDVHAAAYLNWGSEPNLVSFLARLNVLLDFHPCFDADTQCEFVTRGHDNVLVLHRRHAPSQSALLVLVNLDATAAAQACWPAEVISFPEMTAHDLLSATTVEIRQEGHEMRLHLEPGQVRCLASTPFAPTFEDSASAQHQRLKATMHEIAQRFAKNGAPHPPDYGAPQIAEFIARPERFVPALADSSYRPVVQWCWPQDVRRVVMWPAGHVLHVQSQDAFQCDVMRGEVALQRARSFAGTEGQHFVLLMPPAPWTAGDLILQISVYGGARAQHARSVIRCLPAEPLPDLPQALEGDALDPESHYAIACNESNAFAQVRARWGLLASQYDSILAANLHPAFPVDRLVAFTRCRAWIVYRGYSVSLNEATLRRFAQDAPGRIQWRFDVAVGSGKCIRLRVEHVLAHARNAVQLRFYRESDAGEAMLADEAAVELILRPDIEDRDHHHTTKAYQGAEADWAHKVQSNGSGFTFSPSGVHALSMHVSDATFVDQPEWYYMVGHPVEADRGLDGASDLFSPGYFFAHVVGGACLTLSAAVGSVGAENNHAEHVHFEPNAGSFLGRRPVREALTAAMKHYVVKSDGLKTIIAGFPWFLDWGRDTLICLRGLIAAGWREDAAMILKRFAQYEVEGTLPNVMHGEHVGNRDTSDAPLWFIVVCGELVEQGGMPALLEEDCGGRSMKDVLISIARFYMGGTPNGITMDPESKLIFSPSHFTWMDTNHPAGSPRQGYPIEIQALWFASLQVLARLDPSEAVWGETAQQVRASIVEYFVVSGQQHLSDCLHAAPGQSAGTAQADDCLRCNQLFALTLGAIDDPELQNAILQSSERLLVPGAIRSLADETVVRPLPVVHNGNVLNNPLHPYQGQYRGDEDLSRKPAYHNGTAWTWPFPSYVEALYRVHGEVVRETARALLRSSDELLQAGCLGQIPEIVDGDAPHVQRGCGAQAWGVTELFRVLELL